MDYYEQWYLNGKYGAHGESKRSSDIENGGEGDLSTTMSN